MIEIIKFGILILNVVFSLDFISCAEAEELSDFQIDAICAGFDISMSASSGRELFEGEDEEKTFMKRRRFGNLFSYVEAAKLSGLQIDGIDIVFNLDSLKETMSNSSRLIQQENLEPDFGPFLSDGDNFLPANIDFDVDLAISNNNSFINMQFGLSVFEILVGGNTNNTFTNHNEVELTNASTQGWTYLTYVSPDNFLPQGSNIESFFLSLGSLASIVAEQVNVGILAGEGLMQVNNIKNINYAAVNQVLF